MLVSRKESMESCDSAHDSGPCSGEEVARLMLSLQEHLLRDGLLDLNESLQLRVLAHHEWSVPLALHHLRRLLTWQRETRPQRLTVNHVRQEVVDAGLVTVLAEDRLCRPTLLLQGGLFAEESVLRAAGGAVVSREELRLVLVLSLIHI